MPGFLGGSSAGSGGTGGEILFPKEFIDPVTKLRVSQPENLIDTDFEYGLQPTKWETVELINNTPSFFSKSGDTTIDGIQSIITNNGTREITVTTGLDHGLAVGIPINVTGTRSVTADGSYIINSIPNPQTFTYLCKDNQIGDNSIEDLYTSIITGEFFQGSQIRVANAEGVTTDGEAISTLTVTTESTHGFGVNTPFYFLNLNSTISQEFEAANTAAKSFDSSNSATAQTFDGSNTLSSFNIDWSNSATVGGTTSLVATVSTTNNTITVSHSTETFNGLPLGSPLYYDVNTSTGFFASNPRGVVFLKTTSNLGTSQSTFQVSAAPDGDPINIEASMSGTFQIANQARTFAGNNINVETQIGLDIIKETPFIFDASNSDTETNGVGTVLGYSDTILLSVTADAGLDYYQGAMVRYTTTGSAATGLVNNRTYFVSTFAASATPNLYNIRIKELPDSASTLTPTGGSGTQTFTKIGISLDKDIVHVRDSAFQVKDMLKYSYPVGGRFDVASSAEEKNFYFVSKAYDQHNYELSESVFSPTVATGGVISEPVINGRTYRVHTFTTVGSSNFVVSSVGTSAAIDYLIVGGGGGGGGEAGGGGGAGGLIYGTLTATATTYPITVGGGGATYPILGEVDGQSSSPGGNSTFAGFTALGGGRGGSFNNGAVTAISNGAAGGSGGGGASTSTSSFTSGGAANQGASGFGSAGGGGSLRRNYFGGGGGGAGGVGETALLDYPGRGGSGRFYGDIFGTNVGQFGWFASGGAGGSHPTTGGSPQAFSLSGGGGDGGAEFSGDSRGRPGLANTGGGGGGAADDTTAPPANGGVGGSGVVVIRYPITPPVETFIAASATGGTLTQVTSGGVVYNVHAFTATGSSTFTVNSTGNGVLGNFDVFLVGGGGAGSGRHGGGGGAGGLVFVPNLSLTVGAKSLTVGAGGIGAQDVTFNGDTSQGVSSTFNTGSTTITALGGGRPGNQGGGGGFGRAGGSGGGGNFAGTTAVEPGGAGTQPSQAGLSGAPYGFGSAGGSAQRNTNESYPGGGGGGAGGPGQSVANISGGRGGIGLSRVTILGTTYTFANMFGTGYGQNFNGETFFAGGGGGGVWNQFLPLIGGRGGGGNGGFPSTGAPAANGTPGQANTGGGGGGGGGTNTAHFGGNGGSGIVIIRYPVAIV
jgi:hypothetical protein